jgi:G3E family GTPase
LAEPVGSCTDLVATVSYPLRKIYGDDYAIAPLSVMIDPKRCAKIFGITSGRSFSQKVVYVYRKQLEEANFIIINKCDSIDDALRERLVDAMQQEYPTAKILCCSARDGEGLEAWFEQLLAAGEPNAPSMELDYERYGEGEALLGWLNCTIQLQAQKPIDGNQWLINLVEAIRTKLQQASCEIAHLKMMLEPADSNGQVAVVSLVANDQPAELRESLLDNVTQGQLIINLRGEGDPTLLRNATLEALEQQRTGGACFSDVDVQHVEHFRPAKPTPEHRMATA